MDGSTVILYVVLQTHFITHAVSKRSLLSLLDGHLSHYTSELVKQAAEKDVNIFFCRHILQQIASHLTQVALVIKNILV